MVIKVDYFEELLRHAAERPDAIVLQTLRDKGREQLTYGEFLAQASALSQSITRLGVASGDRVAMLLENDHTWVIALFGCLGTGAIAVPLDPSQQPAKLAATIAHAGCTMLMVSSIFADRVTAIREACPGIQVIAKHDGSNEIAGEDWDILVHAEPISTWPLVKHDPAADCLLVYTGGTTGTPKGVRLSLRSLLVCIQDTTAVFPLSPTDHLLSILPLFHIMAIQASVLGPLYCGSRITYLVSRDPQRIVRAFGEERITAFLCVPLFYYQLRRRIFEEIARQPPLRQFLFRRLLRVARFARRSFGWNLGKLFFKPIHAKFGPTLRGFGVGGARFAPEVAESLHDLGFEFFQGYGMTETSALSAITPMSIDGGLSCGVAFARAEIRVDNPDENGVGEVTIRGPHVMSGYWRNDADTAEVLRDGWLSTGDLGYISADRRVHITGRKKDVIVLSSGKNIFPEPLEQHYQSASPLIAEMAICSLADSRGVSEQLHAVIVPDFAELERRGIVNVREAILYDLQSAAKTLPAHERLLGFEIRKDALPRTSARKLQRFRIAEEVAESEKAPVAVEEVATAGEVHPVSEIIRRMKGVHRVMPAMDLELDLGFDSLERVELLANVQDQFGIVLREEEVARILTVEHLLVAVRSPHESVSPNADSTGWRSWQGILSDPLNAAESALAERYLTPRPIAAPILFLLTRIACTFAAVFLRYRFRAVQAWPKRDPFVIAANHQSLLDVPLLAGRLPWTVFRRMFFLSSSRLHRSGFQSWFGRASRAIPIDPDQRLKGALRLAAEGLRRGMVLCVFPEGHRALDESLLPFRKGLAILAVEQRAEVVPVGIRGTGKVWGRARKGFHLSPVSIRAGALLQGADSATPDDFNAKLLAAVTELL